MSNEQKYQDIGKEIEDELAGLMRDLDNSSDEDAKKAGILDTRKLVEENIANLKEFRTMRAEMAAKRAALDKAIKIMDRRIEMALDSVKTLSMPY